MIQAAVRCPVASATQRKPAHANRTFGLVLTRTITIEIDDGRVREQRRVKVYGLLGLAGPLADENQAGFDVFHSPHLPDHSSLTRRIGPLPSSPVISLPLIVNRSSIQPSSSQSIYIVLRKTAPIPSVALS